MKEQRKRIITAAIAIPIVLLLIYLGGWWLGGLLLLMTAISCLEYYRLLERIEPKTFLYWLVLGVAYIGLGFLCFYGTRSLGGILWLLLIVWANDTSAYEVGIRIGKTPLAPAISPKKTVEGAAAGLVGGLIIGFIYGICFMKIGVVASLLIPLFIAFLAQAGDLLESKIKRMADVKDSGNFFPGHGGVLDRTDSVLLTSPFMYFILLILNN
jgi:phosphatidate cytidylyltransferase